MRRQLTGTETTRCGKRYMRRLIDVKMGNGRCPTCRKQLYEDDTLVHDGYRGSPWAHGGAGSYGLADHHYFVACDECALCECSLCKYGATEDELADLKDEGLDYEGRDPRLIAAYAKFHRDGGWLCFDRDAKENPYLLCDGMPLTETLLVPIRGQWTWIAVEGAPDMDDAELSEAIAALTGEDTNWATRLKWPTNDPRRARSSPSPRS